MDVEITGRLWGHYVVPTPSENHHTASKISTINQ